MSFDNKNELSQLIIESLDGSISDQRQCQLDHLLSQNSEALEYYVQHMRIYSALAKPSKTFVESYATDEDVLNPEIWLELAHQEQIAPAIEIQKQIQEQKELIQHVVYPPREKYRISKFSIFTFITSAAAALLLTALYFSAPKSRPVASITGDYRAVWEHSDNAAGTRLWNDGSVYSLQSGIVEITFDSGAKVLIESPADVEMLNENEMFFRGQMTANIPDSAYGFTVKTVNSTVVDLGTEFGIASSDKNGTELHVRKGKVEHVVDVVNQKELSRNSIEAGQASCVDNKGSFSRKQFQGNQFRWDRPNLYELAVLETSPVAYYRFEKETSALGFDEVSRTASQSHSDSVDFVDGPMIDSESENQSLHLAGDAESGVFISDKVVNLTGGRALSISLWVYPEQLKIDMQNIIAYTDKLNNVIEYFTNQIYLTNDNRVGFYLFNLLAEKSIKVETQIPVPLNQWFHVVASWDHEQMKLYVNGDLAASSPVGDFLPQCFEGGRWAIGNGTGRRSRICSPFTGAVDEISFYNRRLSDQEVKILYGAAIKEK